MPRPPLVRSNNDDRRQWRKQGVAVGAAASKTQAKRCGCWVPQPGQWQRVSADGEVKFFLLFSTNTLFHEQRGEEDKDIGLDETIEQIKVQAEDGRHEHRNHQLDELHDDESA